MTRHDKAAADLAQWQYEHADELDATIDDDEVIEVEEAPRTTTVSFRLPVSEAVAIRQAAERSDATVSEWIRRACATALVSEPTIPGSTAIAEIAHLRERLGSLVDTELAEFARRHGVPFHKAS